VPLLFTKLEKGLPPELGAPKRVFVSALESFFKMFSWIFLSPFVIVPKRPIFFSWDDSLVWNFFSS